MSIPLLACTSLLVFVLVANAADPLADLRDQPGVGVEVIEARRQELHLDEPVLARYARWLGQVVRGDLGTSWAGRDVSSLIWDRMQVTLRMLAPATVLALVLAVAVGVVGAVRQHSGVDRLITLLSFLGLSLPVFWVSGLLKEYLAIPLNRLVGRQLVFTVGEADPYLAGSFLERLGNHLGHLVLPTLALVVAPVAVWGRYLRASMLDVLGEDYMRTATAKGLPRSRVVLHHALRNAVAPLATLASLHFGQLFTGVVVVERVFGWQGMGQLLLDGVRTADTTVVSAWLLVTATMIHVSSILADLAYSWLDPRVRI